jgi:hypothetical protein
MGRGIVVSFNGESSEFELTKIERDRLYGRKVRIVVDEKERQCQAALLTRDGSAVIPSGGVASLYVDDHFEVIERSELKVVDAEGNALALCKSTLGVEQPLKGPVDPARMLDFQVASVYLLTPARFCDALKAGLDKGDIFETAFNWRDDYSQETAFLLKSEASYFALVTHPVKLEFLAREAPVVAAGAGDEDEGDDELDFSMM